jgi:hypothetical protein
VASLVTSRTVAVKAPPCVSDRPDAVLRSRPLWGIKIRHGPTVMGNNALLIDGLQYFGPCGEVPKNRPGAGQNDDE